MEAKWCHLNSCLGKTIGRLPITLLKADIFIATVAIPFFIKVARLQVAPKIAATICCGLDSGRNRNLQPATRVAFSFPMVSRRFAVYKASFSVGQYIVLFYRWARTKFIFQLRICRISLHSFGTSQALIQSSLSLFHLINLRRQIIPAKQKNINSRIFFYFSCWF